jgi:hypothetical protein
MGFGLGLDFGGLRDGLCWASVRSSLKSGIIAPMGGKREAHLGGRGVAQESAGDAIKGRCCASSAWYHFHPRTFGVNANDEGSSHEDALCSFVRGLALDFSNLRSCSNNLPESPVSSV